MYGKHAIFSHAFFDLTNFVAKCTLLKVEFILSDLEMGRGKTLSAHTRAKIHEKQRQGASVVAIMQLFQVSWRTVQRCCNEHDKKPKRAGRPPSLSCSDRQKIIAQIRKTPTKPATQISDLVRVSVSSRTIQRFLKMREFNSVRIRKAPRLTKAVNSDWTAKPGLKMTY